MADESVKIEIDQKSLKDLEKAFLTLDQRTLKRAITTGLRSANKVLRTAMKSQGSSRTVARKVRVGRATSFKTSRKGTRLPLSGQLASIASGVPSLRVVPPSVSRAWFIDFSIEKGNLGQSARARQRIRSRIQKGRREPARDPGQFFRIAEGVGPQIVNAFISAAKGKISG